MRRSFRNPAHGDRRSLEVAIACGSAPDIEAEVIAAAFNDADWVPVQDILIGLLHHSDNGVRQVAATGLGHLARLHGQLDRGHVIPILTEMASDPHVGGGMQDALDDIEQYATRDLTEHG